MLLLALLLVVCLTACENGGPREPDDLLPVLPAGRAWRLTWQDAFNGSRLDTSKWDTPDQKRRDGWWSPTAIALDGAGHLAISTRRDANGYVDGCIRTRGKFEHTYGYYVARIKLHSQPGHWPAFWLYSSGVHTVGNEGRDGTEIDIMEKPTLDDEVRHALHWDHSDTSLESARSDTIVPGVMEGWHTFAVWWSPDGYVFYIDGEETWRSAAGGVCRVPSYIKLSDEVGTLAGNIGDAVLPDQFLVDYVRVYDLVDN